LAGIWEMVFWKDFGKGVDWEDGSGEKELLVP
jgi:hypothetical protein